MSNTMDIQTEGTTANPSGGASTAKRPGNVRPWLKAVNATLKKSTKPPELNRPMWEGPVQGGAGPAWEPSSARLHPLFADGIQASEIVAFRGDGYETRPVALCVAAAAATAWGERTPRVLKDTLWATCSYEDRDWSVGIDEGVEWEVSQFRYPSDLRKAVKARTSEVREGLEREVVEAVELNDGELLIVDGSLASHSARERTVGFVKTVGTRYLADERPLADLKPRWCSSTFKLAGRVEGEADRWSCYLRLRPPAADNWGHGLVRLEAWDPELLDAAAVVAFWNRQRGDVGDSRWDHHLIGIWMVEEALRGLCPFFFAL